MLFITKNEKAHSQNYDRKDKFILIDLCHVLCVFLGRSETFKIFNFCPYHGYF